jgi:dinuclear metal center YbgI/SA1388 family protein
MPTIADIAEFLERFAPTRLAAEWDNVGLLVGNGALPARRIMTCLTITGESVAEAVAEKADLIVAHHPLPFRPLKRLTTGTPEGRNLLALIAGGVGVYSPHTAFDSAGRGINQRLAEGISLQNIAPLTADAVDPAIGTGRWGVLAEPASLEQLARSVARFLKIDALQVVNALGDKVRTIAIACGSVGELIGDARRLGCDAFVTGEARFHSCLEAEAIGVNLVLAGHYATERFAVEQLADVLAAEFPGAAVWASRRESDPLFTVSANCP